MDLAEMDVSRVNRPGCKGLPTSARSDWDASLREWAATDSLEASRGPSHARWTASTGPAMTRAWGVGTEIEEDKKRDRSNKT